MTVGWDHVGATELTPNDSLVLHLLAESTPVRLADVVWPSEESPTPLGDEVLAMPVLLRDQLVAIVLYGPHHNGADIDPDEVRAIALLVERAGAAYDHIEARRLPAKSKRSCASARLSGTRLRRCAGARPPSAVGELKRRRFASPVDRLIAKARMR